MELWEEQALLLSGEHRHSLDAKRRLALPARLRRHAKRWVMARGWEGCLSLFTEEEWKTRLQKLDSLPVVNKADARAFKRLLISGATCVDVDGQGRLLVPESLGRFAGIQKDVTVVGLDTRIELWSSERWSQYKKRAEKRAARLAAHIDF